MWQGKRKQTVTKKRMWVKRKTYLLSVGVEAGADTVEISVQSSPKPRAVLPYDPAVPLLSDCPSVFIATSVTIARKLEQDGFTTHLHICLTTLACVLCS